MKATSAGPYNNGFQDQDEYSSFEGLQIPTLFQILRVTKLED